MKYGHSESNPRTYPKMRIRQDYFRVADKPGAISRGGSNRDAKWVISTDSAFFVQVDHFRADNDVLRGQLLVVCFLESSPSSTRNRREATGAETMSFIQFLLMINTVLSSMRSCSPIWRR
jgi:hypothetical protein